MVRELSPELAKIAKDELNENATHLEEDLRHLKEWISKQAYLKARTNDQWLAALLRGCKFSLEKVKKKVDFYYTLKTTAADVLLRMRPTEEKFLEFLRIGSCVILPEAKTLQPRVVLLKPGLYNPEQNNVADLLCVFYYLVQILVIENDIATVLGTKIIIDYSDIQLSHVSVVTPSLIKKMTAITQDSIPLRLKGSHHVSMPAIAEIVVSAVKSLVNEKSRQRLKSHKNIQELLEHFPKEVLPTEYGGSAGSIKEIAEHWAKKFIEYKSWMQVEEELGTDESKRPGKPATAEDMFGLDGSFRKLDID